MYCKNCGSALDNNAAVCIHCGVPNGHGERFCSNCGAEVAPGAAVCMACGYSLSAQKVAAPGAKSKMTGVHNFYLGYKGKAIAQLLITLLSCFMLSEVSAIWGLIEGIMLLSGSINTDADGNPLGD